MMTDEKGRRGTTSSALRLSLIVCLLACSSGGAGPVGSVTVAISSVPADVACLRITAAGATRSATTLHSLVPGTDALVALHGLPLGAVTFTGDAFSASCGAVDTGSVPSWSSDPVPTSIEAAQITAVSLVLHRNGRASVSVAFDDSAPDGGSVDGPTHHGALAYIVSHGDPLYHVQGMVFALDLETNSFLAPIELPHPDYTPDVTAATNVMFSPDGSTAYVAGSVPDPLRSWNPSGVVFVIDVATASVIATIPLDGMPGYTGLVISPDGHDLYVSHGQSSTTGTLPPMHIAVIDTSKRIVAKDAVVTGPLPSAIAPAGDVLYGAAQHALISIDKTSFAVLKEIPLSLASPVSIALTSDGSVAFLGGQMTDQGPRAISVVNLTSSVEVATIALPGEGQGNDVTVALSPDDHRLYVTYRDFANGGDAGKLAIIDTALGVVVSVVPVGYGAHALAVSPDGRRVYVCNEFDRTVSVVDPATGTVIATLSRDPLRPTAIGIN